MSCVGQHVFIYAGDPPDGNIPEGWPCSCGQTALHRKTCGECGQEYTEALPVSSGDSSFTASVFQPNNPDL